MGRGFLIRPCPLEIFFCKLMEGDWVGFLSHVKELVLRYLGFLLGYDLLRTLPGRSNRLPDPLAFESKINVPVFTPLVDRHLTHPLSIMDSFLPS